MAREGFLCVDKPIGLSSFQVVRRVKQLLNADRVGHSGTLDPFATGLLVLGIGKHFTRRLDEIQALPKTYEVTFVLGIMTDTFDACGKITAVHADPIHISADSLQEALGLFKGDITQTPPVFSAKKIQGKPAYKLARQGKEVTLSEVTVRVDDIQLLGFCSFPNPQATLKIHCSKGTYVRSIVHDLGQKLGVGAYCRQLNRSAVGQFSQEHALPFNALSTDVIQQKLVNFDGHLLYPTPH